MTDPRPGRRTLLTPDLVERIAEVVRAGNYLKTAAQFVGVGRSTLGVWLARGRAAAAAVEAHDPDGFYCPACDRDRTDEVRAERETNRRLADAGDTSRAVMPNCLCGDSAYPQPWLLPEPEQIYLTFVDEITKAEAVPEIAAVTHWRRAFTDDWRAARDYLARKRPDQWAAKTTVTVSSEEAEARIERATAEALASLGLTVDLDGGLDDADDPRAVAPLDF